MNSTASAADQPPTPFEQIGGGDVVRRIVDRFYDLMDQDPRYGALRALHAPDLAPMRASLTGFLTAWLGGPRDWFAQHPGACVMSAHARIGVTGETAEQWVAAMGRAVSGVGIEAELAVRIKQAFARMASGMVRR